MKVFYNKGKTIINFGEHERLSITTKELNAGNAFVFACDAEAQFECVDFEDHYDLNELVDAIAEMSETTSIMYWRNVFDKLAEKYSCGKYQGFNKHMENIARQLINDQSPAIIKEEFADWNINSYIIQEIDMMMKNKEIDISVDNEEVRVTIGEAIHKGVDFLENYLEELDEGVQWIDVSYNTRTKEMFLTFYAGSCKGPYETIIFPNVTAKFARATQENIFNGMPSSDYSED